jgi:hypothetical protein
MTVVVKRRRAHRNRAGGTRNAGPRPAAPPIAAAWAPPSWPYLLILALWAAGTALIVTQASERFIAEDLSGLLSILGVALLTMVAISKSLGLYYLIGTVAKSITYLLLPRPAPAAPRRVQIRPVAVLYLTAGDFDRTAVDSILRLRSAGPKFLLIHDDGNDEDARRRMHAFALNHPCASEWQIEIWHRPARIGGKAGAVNWCLQRLDPQWELMLLCDSDSIAVDSDALLRAEPEFDDPAVAVVQFRNVGFAEPHDAPFIRQITRAIDVFDVFAAAQWVWGYTPFFGHNAILRLQDLREHGGFTPGFFSDDLDFSARLTLAGKRIVYRRDIPFAERHPTDHLNFRKRGRKWALGCTQVVRHRARHVLTARNIPLAHRIGLLEFMCFYPAMAIMLAGLLASHLVLPLIMPGWTTSPVYMAIGALVVLALMTPTLAWAIRNRQLRQWPGLAWSCILVYGNSLIPTIQGVLDGLKHRDRPWIPTNLAEQRPAIPTTAWREFALGLSLFMVPWMCGSAELLSPSTYLFIATFLFAPLTFAGFREHATSEPADVGGFAGGFFVLRRWRLRLVSAAAAGIALIAVPAILRADVPTGDAATPAITVSGDQLLLDGKPFQVRGIHYSPWGPGTGPDGNHAYPSREVVSADLKRIKALGVNTVYIHSAPGWVAGLAADFGLHAIYKIHINWNDTSEQAFEQWSRRTLEQVESLKLESNIFMWIIGNEIPRWVVDELGADEQSRRLNLLATQVREADPARLIGHANWPVTRELDLSAFDIACFNLYPAWPYEVSVRGFGPFLRDVLIPLAAGKPLLISEFGINTLEAGDQRQAQVITDCWREIDSSASRGVVGGVVFAWMDEWWKNFDNPIPGKGYWERQYDPDDALRHDDDPEEHYGIVRFDRTPKPAYHAVAAMWGQPMRSAILIWMPWVIVAALAVFSWFVLGLGRSARRRRATQSPHVSGSPITPMTAAPQPAVTSS